ncbi:MAG: NTP transferase domain-containing protein [Candidatus Levybacteria bacterium]|nr:NTP transferase domain-containing protein [Candidatus Levybacteria bacterium]
MNSNYSDRKIAAIILAAGEGKRMRSETGENKVISLLANKPMIVHIVEFMSKIAIDQIIVVVGHAKDSVKKALHGYNVSYAVQVEQHGTGDAVKVALTSLLSDITDVVVVYGDDAVLYSKENTMLFSDLIKSHISHQTAVTFLTIEQENPFGLGRILRDRENRVVGIVEEKDATEEQKRITEINPGSFVFSVDFLKKYLPLIQKSEATGEYYLTSLIDIALENGERVEAIKGGAIPWRGVNTPEELVMAEKLMSKE